MSTEPEHVPAYVRQMAEAEQQREQQDQQERTAAPVANPGDTNPPPERPAAVVAERPTSPEPTSIRDLLGDAQPAQPAARTPEATPQPPQPASTASDARIAELEQALDAERHRFATLQGKINVEGPRNAEAIRELREELRELKVQREEQQKLPAWQRKLQPDEISEFKTAEDALGVSGRVTLAIVEDMLDKLVLKLTGQIKPVAAKIEAIDAQESKRAEAERAKARVESVLEQVEAHRPGARNTNFKDANFDKFLKTVKDPVSQKLWGVIAAAALGSEDIGRLVDVFKAYDAMLLAEGGTPPSLDGLVRPQTVQGSTGATGGGKPKPVLTEAWVNRFYTDVAYQRYKGREDEQKQIQAMIDEAERENRIQPG